MAAALNVHGKVTTQDGTVFDKVQVIVRANTARVRKGRQDLANRADVTAVTQGETGVRSRIIVFADGSQWQVERGRGCNCR